MQATEYHLGLLKAKLARYRAELLEGAAGGGGKAGAGFDVAKAGFGRAVLIGFPSVGKSTLLSKVTSTESAAAAYAFTTLVAVPGGESRTFPLSGVWSELMRRISPPPTAVMEVEGAKIQREQAFCPGCFDSVAPS